MARLPSTFKPLIEFLFSLKHMSTLVHECIPYGCCMRNKALGLSVHKRENSQEAWPITGQLMEQSKIVGMLPGKTIGNITLEAKGEAHKIAAL